MYNCNIAQDTVSRNNNKNKTMKWASESASIFLDSIDERLSAKEQRYRETGLSSLDRAFPALLHNGHLIIVAARPSMGKTALAQQVAEHVAQAQTVAFYTLEMSNYEITERGICKRADVSISDVKTLNTPNTETLSKLLAGADEFGKLHMLIDDGAYTIQDICKKATALENALQTANRPPLGLIVVDYVQLVDGGAAQNRNLEIGKISRALKRLAQELKVPVLALSQLNRSLESRTNKRPIMSDLRESGNLEQDADCILAIYRDEIYDPTSADAGTAEIIGLKNRHGGKSTVKTAFIGEKLKFGDLAYDYIPKTTQNNSNGSKRGGNRDKF